MAGFNFIAHVVSNSAGSDSKEAKFVYLGSVGVEVEDVGVLAVLVDYVHVVFAGFGCVCGGCTMVKVSLSGKREVERHHGSDKYRSILSWEWLVCDSTFLRVVAGFFLFTWTVGMGGGNVGGLLSLQSLGSLCIMALEVGSLFSRIAYLHAMRFTWCFSGGMEASTSRAAVGVVLNAAHISSNAFLWTLLRGLAWHLVLFHHMGHAYRILGTTHDR